MLLAAGILLLAQGGCLSERTAPASEIAFSADALRAVLAPAERLTGTPLADRARSLRSRIADCQEVFARLETDPTEGPDPLATWQALWKQIACVDATSEVSAAARKRRGPHAGRIVLALTEGGSLELRVGVDEAGDLEIEGDWRPGAAAGPLRLLVPADEAPAPAAIEGGEALIHLHARARDGLRIAPLLASGGQADALFALKGRLLEGALLEGSWELAFLPDPSPARIPLPVGALHHRTADGVALALDEALDRLEQRWPIRRTPRRFVDADGAAHEGGCFLELPLLPELAPCWVVTPRALLIGYRAEAIDAALRPREKNDGARQDAPPALPRSRGLVHLDRIRAFDGQPGSGDEAVDPARVWEQLEIEALDSPSDEAVRFAARLAVRR